MKKRPLYIILVLILIMLLSGCLPKVPEKITGPTWTSKYRIPLIKLVGEDKIYFNHEPADDSGENLGLEDVKTDLSFTLEMDEPITFDLMDEPPTVNLSADTIDDFSLNIPDWLPGVVGEFDVAPQQMDVFLTEDLEEYINITLNENQTSANYIDIELLGATAAGEGFTIVLWEGEEEHDRVEIAANDFTGRLNMSGLVFSPETSLRIEAYGRLATTGAQEIGVTFNPAPLEISSFIITKNSFEQNFTDDFQVDNVEETIELPEEIEELELTLNTASFDFESSFPENMIIKAKITLAACNENGDKLTSFTKDITFSGENDNLDLIGEEPNLNTIFKSKPHHLVLKLEGFSVGADGDLTISYPENSSISLDYVMSLGVESLTYSPTEGDGIETGEIEIPEDLPVNFASGELFLDIFNSSSAGLQIDLWLSDTPHSFDDKIHFNLTIDPNDGSEESTTSNLSMTSEQFDMFVENDLLYYELKITNSPDETAGEPFGSQDYLEITAWADVEVKVNPR